MAATLCLAAPPAMAQRLFCSPWEQLRDDLRQRFREVPIGGGLVSDRAIVEVLAAPEGATFSVVVVRSDGTACMIATGTGWEPGENPPAGEDH